MKKLLVILIVAALACSMAFALTACNNDQGSADIAILVPNADHGWTGAILSNATAWANSDAKGDYSVKVITAATAADQISQIEDIAANKNYKSVVILPYDNSVEGAMRQLASSGVDFIMVDRIIDAVVDDAVATVKGDNEMIGAITAKRFIEDGLEPGDKILIIPGDNSSVPEMRNKGFKEYLLSHGWTEGQYNASVTSTAYTGWSRATGKQLFIDWITANTVATIDSYDYIFTHDSEIALGIFEALKESTLDADKKAAFLNGTVHLASSSGLNEAYQIMKNQHPRDYSAEYAALADFFDVTYPPSMIKDALDMMVKHLNGEAVESKIIVVEAVDASNVDQFEGFV